MNPWVRKAALIGFPAGFAAAAPFLAEMAAHLPLMVFGAEAWDSHTQLFDAANAGEVGKALGPLWLIFELLLMRAGEAKSRRWLAALAMTAAVAPAIHVAAKLPWDYRWMAWGVGLSAGLFVARVHDPRSRLLWALWPALVTFVALHAWRVTSLPAVPWGLMALKPAVAGGVAGLVVRVGRDQGLRWGRTTPPEPPAES